MSKKWWCLFGVHEYKVFDNGPYELTTDWGRKQGNWYNLRCEVCGKLKYKVLVR